MQRLLTSFAFMCLAFAACRRPQPAGGPVQVPPGLSLDEPESPPAEDDDDSDQAVTTKPPPAPPKPSAPTVPPPTKMAGFNFGQSRADAWQACSKKGTWKRYGEHWLCTKPLVDPGFQGSPVLSFCDDKVCAIGFAIVPDSADYKTWSATFEKIRQILIGRYGAATKSEEQIPDDCKGENFVDCLDAGKARAESLWQWTAGHKVVLRMSQKSSGEGPPAIRLVSLPTASPQQ